MRAAESPGGRPARRVPKPLMEKRRRDRINQSLETLRVLMLENTQNERLENPKVEKAEILESVVQFLKSGSEAEKGHKAAQKVPSREQKAACTHQHPYREGMRSCLMRVSHFIATKSQQLEEAGGGCLMRVSHFIATKSQQLEEAGGGPAQHPASSGHLHRPLMPPQQRPYLSESQRRGLHCGTRTPLSPKAATELSEPVWRPWPQ
ncbi:hypothetical protein LDENG_00126550 [Lucifuga dentata]|nr:hypothetical protein LDENG_00126550 [Lucifuga dentata]